MMEFTFWSKNTNNFFKFLVDSNFDRNLFDIDDCEKFVSFLYDRINNKQQVVNSAITLKYYGDEGIEYIKKLFKNMLNLNKSDEKIKVKFVKSSEYLITSQCSNPIKVIEIIKTMLDYLQTELTNQDKTNFTFNVSYEPKLIEG